MRYLLHFPYYILMNFLMMLSVILLSMLMILLFILLTWCPHTFEPPPPKLWTLSPRLTTPKCNSIYEPPQEMLVHDLWKNQHCQGCWQMHRCYIYSKYFVNRLAILSLYQKSFINNKLYSVIVNRIKCMYWFSYRKVIGPQRKTSEW